MNTSKIVKDILREFIENEAIKTFSLSRIPTSELKRQYVNFRLTMMESSFGNPLLKHNGKYIIENAKFTEPLEKVKPIIEKKYGLKDWQFEIRKAYNNIEIAIIAPEIDKNVELITDDMNQFGYFLGFSETVTYEGMKWVRMQFEPRFQNEINDVVRKYHQIYHITPTYNLENIKRIGLIPSSKREGFSYPNRIFFIKGDTSFEEIAFIGQQLSDKNSNEKNDGKYSLLVIDTKNIPTDVNFFLDPNYGHGIFTEQPIPPSAIKSIIPLNYAKKREE